MRVRDQIASVQIKSSIAELAEESLAAGVLAASAERDAAASDVEKAHAAVEAAQRELAGAEAGDGRDESNRSMQERLSDAQNAQVCSVTGPKRLRTGVGMGVGSAEPSNSSSKPSTHVQTKAEADTKQADARAKHLQKQLAEQRRALSSKEKEAGQLQAQLAKEQAAVDSCKQRWATGPNNPESVLPAIWARVMLVSRQVVGSWRRLQSLGHDEAAVSSLEAEVERETAAVRQCRERVDELSSSLAGRPRPRRD